MAFSFIGLDNRFQKLRNSGYTTQVSIAILEEKKKELLEWLNSRGFELAYFVHKVVLT